MKALDAEMKLSGRTAVFTPVKYLIPIKNVVSNAPSISESGRTCPKQGPDTASTLLQRGNAAFYVKNVIMLI